jgi:hypothetical protein
VDRRAPNSLARPSAATKTGKHKTQRRGEIPPPRFRPRKLVEEDEDERKFAHRAQKLIVCSAKGMPMFRLLPTNTKFFDHFDRICETLVLAAERLRQFIEKPEHADRCASEIKRLEHEADEETHDTLELLHRSFITPIDRGEIRRLTETLDDVLDLLDDASRRIVLYEITEMLPGVLDLVSVLVEATKVVSSAVHQLRHLQKKHDIIQKCIEIRRLENEGDQINHEILARLFKAGIEPLLILKWKEIIVDIETAIDRCQDVSNVLEAIVLESA